MYAPDGFRKGSSQHLGMGSSRGKNIFNFHDLNIDLMLFGSSYSVGKMLKMSFCIQHL